MDGYVYLDIARSGESNMAIDRQLLEAAERLQCAFVRVYRWAEPTLSLGHFQASCDRNLHPASARLPLVLRASGGGAIVHDLEWTYSVALPVGRNKIGAATQLYDLVHAALVSGLRSLGWDARQWSPPPIGGALKRDSPGPIAQRGCGSKAARDMHAFLCFQRRSCGDIVCNGHKVVGSAQRRLGSSVLQHGSVLWSRSRFAPELAGLCDIVQTLTAPERRHVAGMSQQVANRSQPTFEEMGDAVLSWVAEPLVGVMQVNLERISQPQMSKISSQHHQPESSST